MFWLLRSFAMLGATIFLLELSLALPTTILYPGSFDPFHKTHETEVQLALDLYPDARVVILPIEQADYTPRIVGSQTFRPKFLDYDNRLVWIDYVFLDDPRVESSNYLEEILTPMPTELLEAVDHFGATHLLVGTDVLVTWSHRGMLEGIVEKVQLLVTNDPQNPKVREDIHATFSTHPHWNRIEWIEGVDEGLRSVEVQKKIAQRENLDPYLPNQISQGIKSGDFKIEDLLREYVTRVTEYLRESFEREVWLEVDHALSTHAGEELADLVFESSTLMEFMAFHSMQQGLNIGGMERLLRDQSGFDDLPDTIKNHLNRTLAITFNLPEISTWYYRHSHFLEMIQTIASSGMAEKPSTNRTRPMSQNLGYMAFRFLTGPAAKPIQDFLSPLFGLRLPNQEIYLDPPFPTGEDEFVYVYRGVRWNPDLESREKNWLEEGFLSKVALMHRLAGDSLEASLQRSREFLDEQGLQNALIDHIFGQWKEHTALISLSLDKNIATEFAGPGGRVYTLRVPVSQLIFSNDLFYWQNTPWEETGNPSSKQLEVMIPHHIPADQIVSAETVNELKDGVATMSASFLPAVLNYSQYIKLSAQTRQMRTHNAPVTNGNSCVDLLNSTQLN